MYRSHMYYSKNMVTATGKVKISISKSLIRVNDTNDINKMGTIN